MIHYQLNIPYVEALYQGGKQRPKALVLKPSFTHSREGSALAVAQHWHKAKSFWDAGHYTVDESKMFQCVKDRVIAGSDKQSKGTIRIAMCAEPASKDVFWNAEEHSKLIDNTAKLVAELSLAYKIPIEYLDEAEFSRWQKLGARRRRGGIHLVEPSGWPKELFLQKVKTQLQKKN